MSVIVQLIVAAALAHGVNATAMVNTAGCESGWNPFSVSNPPYVGLFQLGPKKQYDFFAAGYDNLFDPAQQANFVAEVVHAEGPHDWPTWGKVCRFASL